MGQVTVTVFFTIYCLQMVCRVCVGGGGENTMFYTMETCREQRQVQVGDGGECKED